MHFTGAIDLATRKTCRSIPEKRLRFQYLGPSASPLLEVSRRPRFSQAVRTIPVMLYKGHTVVVALKFPEEDRNSSLNPKYQGVPRWLWSHVTLIGVRSLGPGRFHAGVTRSRLKNPYSLITCVKDKTPDRHVKKPSVVRTTGWTISVPSVPLRPGP